ncbi:MAG TPA: hypothetical protein PLV50_01635 [Smithella sp.]|nr:hypothetical protein [Smithella sp.]HOG89210.1 hypothetical protein [Smithella sp.]HQJ68841.1 hypothetical protein [Anaerohalosphaeraceae bacterium]
MRRLLFALTGAATVIILLGGCVASRIDADFGTSYKLSKINQIINPEAEKNLEPVNGLSGMAVEGVIDRYETGFRKEKPAPTYTLTVGGFASGQ